MVNKCWRAPPHHSDQEIRSFTEHVIRTEYRPIYEATQRYKVFLHNQNQHWYLLVHNDDTNYAYIGLEIITDKTKGLIPAVRVLYQRGTHLTYNPDPNSELKTDFTIPFSHLIEKGTVTKSIKSICEIANGVKAKMGSYEPATNNCQHFVNNLLQQLGLEITRTTIGPETTIPAHTYSMDTHSLTGSDGGACN